MKLFLFLILLLWPGLVAALLFLQTNDWSEIQAAFLLGLLAFNYFLWPYTVVVLLVGSYWLFQWFDRKSLARSAGASSARTDPSSAPDDGHVPDRRSR